MVSVVELDLYDRSGRAYLLEPAKEAGLAILIGFDFDKQDRSSRLVVAEADSNAMRALKCKGSSWITAEAFVWLLQCLLKSPDILTVSMYDVSLPKRYVRELPFGKVLTKCLC